MGYRLKLNRPITFVLFSFLFTQNYYTQSIKDSSIRVITVGIHVSGQLPKKDLENRFGPNLSAGANVEWKTKQNLIFNLEGSFIFGSNVKENVLSNLQNETGQITDNEGYPADLRVTERGWNFYGNIGYLFSRFGNNPNSGVMVTAGIGWMQHKIKLYDANQNIAAVSGDLKKGYDHLSGGLAFSQFIGYKYLGDNRLTNFYCGIECYEGLTQSLREFNYNTGLPDTQRRLDVLIGIRFGWILPLYNRNKDYYYN